MEDKLFEDLLVSAEEMVAVEKGEVNLSKLNVMGGISNVELEYNIKRLSENLERKEYLNCLSKIAECISTEEPLLPQAIQLKIKGLSLRYFLIILYKNFNTDEKLKDQLTKLEDLELNLYLRKVIDKQ